MSDLEQLAACWLACWEDALALWSRYTRLSEPRWCLTEEDEKREGLIDSFAMIRIEDQAVVISLRQIREHKLEAWALEILGHEIGHHVFCPGNLLDHAQALAQTCAGLPTKEHLAPFILNLYQDLLINNRLQRSAGLKLDAIYRTLGKGSEDPLWNLYMRTYEILWSLQRETLTSGPVDSALEADALLGARLVRACQREWIAGAGPFASLCFPYLLADDGAEVIALMAGWSDTQPLGKDAIPYGLVELGRDGGSEPLHPALDSALNGGYSDSEEAPGSRPGSVAARQKRCRDVAEYGQLLQSLGLVLDPQQRAMAYYRERALPHLISFPATAKAKTTELLPEGFEGWQIGDDLDEADWFETAVRSPVVAPGWTTVRRRYGESSGKDARQEKHDLYIGIDCSGSMPNPQEQVSYPALAGTILALSALRAGVRVKVVLSGEPGQTYAMPNFARDEQEILGVLCSYLGTGYAFGIWQLEATFAKTMLLARPAHIVVISDSDIFYALDEQRASKSGWQVARDAAQINGGTATFVLHEPDARQGGLLRMREMGWNVHCLDDWPSLVQFAREFSCKAFQM